MSCGHRAGARAAPRFFPASIAPLLLALGTAALLGACASPNDLGIDTPVHVPPVAKPLGIERVNTGAIFQAGMQVAPYAWKSRPRRIGDTLKVDISESVSAKNAVSTSASRESALASKGPGTSESNLGILKGILNLNATASGSDSFKGTGNAEDSSSFKGQMAALVINVLPNGHLLVAGERSTGQPGGKTVLRFSGLVDPKDLKDGNVVASADVVNARFEMAGAGEVSEAGSRSWLQRILANSLRVW